MIDGLNLTRGVCLFVMMPDNEIGMHKDRYLGMVTELLTLNLDGYSAVNYRESVLNRGPFEHDP